MASTCRRPRSRQHAFDIRCRSIAFFLTPTRRPLYRLRDRNTADLVFAARELAHCVPFQSENRTTEDLAAPGASPACAGSPDLPADGLSGVACRPEAARGPSWWITPLFAFLRRRRW